ncbi:T-cell surface glycoprotein CD3 epsilon chain-like protein [Anopheles sinensis]|uniref:T-cell surface glycoprotein CD3 epsilon chain-like protein n=1 Tax=Anopheles sinensis TaxID=74873 RepID=A0A084WGC9_ANOSI|nr:T-cell surface glycoprotein CD3 epsilon chain-like protein [Anopheles sinensis]
MARGLTGHSRNVTFCDSYEFGSISRTVEHGRLVVVVGLIIIIITTTTREPAGPSEMNNGLSRSSGRGSTCRSPTCRSRSHSIRYSFAPTTDVSDGSVCYWGSGPEWGKF